MSNEELKLQDPRCRIQCPDILPENTGVAAQCISQDKMSNEALKLQDPRCRIQCPGHPARKYWTHKSVISLTD